MNELYDFTKGDTAEYLRLKYIKILKLDSKFEIEIGSENYNANYFGRTADGFFKRNAEGQISRHYAYLSSYKVIDYGRPVMHLVDCETMQKYSNFSLSNSETVDIHCRNTGFIYEDQKLKICKNCIDMLNKNMSASILNKSFDDFVLDFEEDTNTKQTETTIDGYTINWPQISTAFRNTKEFKCKRCHVQIKEKEHKHFMQTHHKDYNKLNNTRSNLECLCISCHANVDERHRRNFSTGGNMALLEEFRIIYH